MRAPAVRAENLDVELRRHVLLVDDNEMVRDITAAMLARADYDVRAASTPAEAIELAGNGTPIDLLVTDVMMPGMNGVELADELIARHPELNVLFTSGYLDEGILAPGRVPAGAVFLAKPFSMADLVAAAEDVFAVAGGTAR